jgi:hypothetical protein
MIQIIRNLIAAFWKQFRRKPILDLEEIRIEPIPEEKEVHVIVDKQLRNKYKKGWEKKGRSKPLTEIVIHGTGGGSTVNGLLKWMMSGARAKDYNRGIGLFHYAIGHSGSAVELVDPRFWVYHSSSGRHDRLTIGIELLNTSRSNSDPYTDKQYEKLFILIFDYLMNTYPSINMIVGHGYNKAKYSRLERKRCPGSGFNWGRLREEMVRRGVKYETIDREAYKIVKS